MQIIDLQLKELLVTEFKDLRMFNAVLWLTGNLLPTNSLIKESFVNKTSLVKCLLEVLQKNQHSSIDADLLETMLWVISSINNCKNMSKQAVD